MRKIMLLLGAIIIGSLLAGCSRKTVAIGEMSSDFTNIEITEEFFEAEVIETGERILIAPEEDSDAYRSSDKISTALIDTLIFDSDGNEMEADQLKPGDIVRIAYNGMIAESYPAQITALRIDLIKHNILIDGYMALIEDIYEEDSGLNGDITMIAFNTTGWIEVNEIEKEIILFQVGEKYGLEVVQGTFDELAEQGLIDKENLYFEKGILIEVKNMKYNEEDGRIECAISKWRSGLGAIGADETAEFDASKWRISKENQWIS